MFRIPAKKFPCLSEDKLIEGSIVDPDVRKLINDKEFESRVTTKK